VELDLQSSGISEFLKKTVKFKEVWSQILQQQIVARAAHERGLKVTPEEVQAEADCFRYENRLEKASDMHAWLADQLISVEEWEAGIYDRLLARNLARFLFTKEVEKFFVQKRLDFDQVLLYQIVVPFYRVAQELFYQIEEQEISFYEAAHLYDVDERRRHQCGYEGKTDRGGLKPDIATVVFSAQIGEVTAPLETEQGYHLFMVQEIIPAELTPERYQTILDDFFKEWLDRELDYVIHNFSQ